MIICQEKYINWSVYTKQWHELSLIVPVVVEYIDIINCIIWKNIGQRKENNIHENYKLFINNIRFYSVPIRIKFSIDNNPQYPEILHNNLVIKGAVHAICLLEFFFNAKIRTHDWQPLLHIELFSYSTLNSYF